MHHIAIVKKIVFVKELKGVAACQIMERESSSLTFEDILRHIKKFPVVRIRCSCWSIYKTTKSIYIFSLEKFIYFLNLLNVSIFRKLKVPMCIMGNCFQILFVELSDNVTKSTTKIDYLLSWIKLTEDMFLCFPIFIAFSIFNDKGCIVCKGQVSDTKNKKGSNKF